MGGAPAAGIGRFTVSRVEPTVIAARAEARTSAGNMLRWAAGTAFLTSQMFQPWGEIGIVVATLLTLLVLDVERPYALINIIALYNYLILEVGPSAVDIANPDRMQTYGAATSAALLLGTWTG